MVEMVETRCGWRWWSWKRKKLISFNFYYAGPDDAFRCIWSYEPDGANIWAVDPQYRLNAMIATTVVFCYWH